MHAKLLAIYQDLKIANDLGEVYNEIESNSLEAINLIRYESFSMHEFSIIVDDIKHVMSRNNKILIKHILREANQNVDILVKIGLMGLFSFIGRFFHFFRCPY